MVALHLFLLPFVARTWRATGDEPHYLLAAHSLVTDRDFDLRNNYDQFDYLNFYYSRDITRQIRFNERGAQILDHQPGLPLLIAPAYALAGRTGVLVFQAFLGGLLAAVTFRLALVISQNQVASLLATLFVVLSPPLFLYHYLVYPEVVAALLTTMVVYQAISRDAPTRGSMGWTLLSLAALPWLNRRFIVLAPILALLIAWAWRDRNRAAIPAAILRRGWPGLALAAISIGFLLWVNSHLMSPERVDITLAVGGNGLWMRLLRGIGWLVDQQRGLLIYGPVYIAAIFGFPFLIKQKRDWFVTIPFFVSLGVTTLAGGYWVAWELGPRFLVVALPALAPLLALSWHHYGRTMPGKGAMLFLFLISLTNSWVIVRNFELPYKSSLPLAYSRALGLPLIDYLPDMAQRLRISPQTNNVGTAHLLTDAGEQVWFSAAGQPASLIQAGPLHELPFGHYRLTWELRTDPGTPPATDLLRVSVQTVGGGQVHSQIITAADLPPDGSYGEVSASFLNPNVDRWRTPLVLQAVSTAQGNLWAKGVTFHPNPFFNWVLPYLYLILGCLGTFLAWRWRKRAGRPATLSLPLPKLSPWPPLAGWGVALLLPLIALGYLAFQQTRTGRTYDAIDLAHLAGRPIADGAAAEGRAWLVDPLIDAPQKAVYGPLEFFEAGQYRVTFRLKLPEAVEPEREIAHLQVTATANFNELITQPLLGSNFSDPERYHLFVLTVNNPRRQALSFEVDYPGEAALVIDEVIVEKIDVR